MKKNDIYDIKIEDIGNDGEGIGHITETDHSLVETGMVTGRGLSVAVDSYGQDHAEGKGIVIFVKDTIPGDIARVRIVKVKKQYAYGRLEEIIKPSPYRVTSPCSKARSCGGCTLMHMSYEKQLEYKWNKVKSCLERIGGIEDVSAIMEPVSGMVYPYYYRNKMQFPVGVDRNGRVQIGFYAGRTHSIVDLEDCKIGHPVNHYIIKELRIWLQDWQDRTNRFIYNEETHSGLVRHILTRVGYATGELMVCVVINGDDLPSLPIRNASFKKDCIGKTSNEAVDCKMELKEHLLNAVQAYNQWIEQDGIYISEMPAGEGNAVIEEAEKKYSGHIELKSLSININKEKTNRILGNTCKVLMGNPFIIDRIGDIQFHISPLSFYQVNPMQTKVLYDKALEYADLHGEEIVWDLYCGIGTISLCLAKKAGKVYGVEIVSQAVDDARKNAKINGMDHVEFFCGKAEEVVPEFYRTGDNRGRHPHVVVVDPPRKGCDEILLETIVKMSPERIVYVSCDPATLARDVGRLEKMKYELKKVGVVDQFGHSGHVETCCLLTRIK